MAISYEDETSYTSMRGSFVDGQAWWDGEILTNLYTSDFSADEDSWTADAGGAITGNVDGISDGTISYDDVVRFVLDASTGFHRIQRNTPDLNDINLVKISFSYYIPAANSIVDSISFRDGSGGNLGINVSTTGVWTDYVGYITSVNVANIRFYAANGGFTSFQDAGGDDIFYLKNIVISSFVSLSTQSFRGNLLIVDDGDGDLARGFIGEAGTSEVATALPNNVTAISSADPGVISSVAHDLSIGAIVYFDSLTEMTELNGVYKVVTAVGSADLFSIDDTSGFAAETTGGACAHEITEPNANAVKIYKERALINEGWESDNVTDHNAGPAWNFNVHRMPGVKAQQW